MKNMKKWRSLMLLVTILAVLASTAATCDGESDADKQSRELSDRIAKTFADNQPPHVYDASQAVENLIAAQDAMALGADTWTVQTVDGKGVIFECPSRGIPVPLGSQITPPEKVVDREGGDVTLPQIEPYGLYPPSDVRGTLANCVLPDGSVGVFYSEPDVTAYTFDVEYDPTTGKYEISDNAKASVKVTQVTEEEVNIRDAEG